MSKKGEFVQIEMFNSEGMRLEKQEKKGSALGYICGHEKAILIVIGFLVVAIGSFSLGVKKGQQLSLLGLQEKESTISPRASGGEIPKETRESKGTDKKKKKFAPVKKRGITNYTIQVATYRTETYARREAEKLKKKGLRALVLPVGSYVQLCVGEFLDKKEAKIALEKLKKKYQDCFIRRL